jgi:hypothetical protein
MRENHSSNVDRLFDALCHAAITEEAIVLETLFAARYFLMPVKERLTPHQRGQLRREMHEIQDAFEGAPAVFS